uniref:Mitochondrial inner membrane protein OXA1L n=1 Tax=Salvator merianae TaxID=96440 RepID=A0A8D0BD97_SALMN
MAAPAVSASVRRAWSRAGVTWAIPLVRTFHRQVHRTFIPHIWLQRKAPPIPRSPSLGHCQIHLLRPAHRHQSTAAVAGTQIIQAAAVSPLESTVSTGDLGQELSLAELGLGSYTPVGFIQNLLESFHMDMGLPWWGAIVAGTALTRCLVFPLFVKSRREGANLSNHLPKITELSNRLKQAKQTGNQHEIQRTYTELELYQKSHNVKPLQMLLVPLVQVWFPLTSGFPSFIPPQQPSH